MSSSEPAAAAKPRMSFAAMRHPAFRWFFFTYVMAMMADNIEHVISYWIMFQKFHSPALGGFAVLSHWLPYLFFSVPVGILGERVNPQRLIQLGMVMFAGVSLGWGYFFVTDSLQMWHAMVLLVLHGCAGVFWQTSSQLLLHEVVPASDLQSAVRLNATARYLGVLVGPAVGGAMLLLLGPAHGIFLNTLYYLPLILWLWRAPYGERVKATIARSGGRAVRSLSDIVRTIGDIANQPALVSMMVLAGAASFFIGNSYQAQMPNFANDLGHGDPGTSYSMLLAADAAGALVAGFLLESMGSLRTSSRSALLLALGWCLALTAFALTRSYPVALACLFVAGFFELSFSSMAQTVVQLNAPAAIRGRVLGLFNMAALGCRAFAGITVGISGALLGVHASLAIAAVALMVIVLFLLVRQMRLRV
ncbi:MAG: MFS transporter [Sphingobium sp.]